MLPPLMSYSLAPSSTMMPCTVHSPTDSLAQPSCIVVYIVCNPAPRGSPFKLSLGLRSNSRVLSSPPSQSPLVWWFVLGLPWVTSESMILTESVLAIQRGEKQIERPEGKHGVTHTVWYVSTMLRGLITHGNSPI